MARRLSKAEAEFNEGWTCDICKQPIDRFTQATGGRQDDAENKISRHAACQWPRMKEID